jgi:hypothetical protein
MLNEMKLKKMTIKIYLLYESKKDIKTSFLKKEKKNLKLFKNEINSFFLNIFFHNKVNYMRI